jgi:hypothetical protein
MALQGGEPLGRGSLWSEATSLVTSHLAPPTRLLGQSPAPLRSMAAWFQASGVRVSRLRHQNRVAAYRPECCAEGPRPLISSRPRTCSFVHLADWRPTTGWRRPSRSGRATIPSPASPTAGQCQGLERNGGHLARTPEPIWHGSSTPMLRTSTRPRMRWRARSASCDIHRRGMSASSAVRAASRRGPDTLPEAAPRDKAVFRKW